MTGTGIWYRDGGGGGGWGGQCGRGCTATAAWGGAESARLWFGDGWMEEGRKEGGGSDVGLVESERGCEGVHGLKCFRIA